jgi:hypothetical protein
VPIEEEEEEEEEEVAMISKKEIGDFTFVPPLVYSS